MEMTSVTVFWRYFVLAFVIFNFLEDSVNHFSEDYKKPRMILDVVYIIIKVYTVYWLFSTLNRF